MQFRTLLAFSAVSVHCWVILSFLTTRCPKLLSIYSLLSLYLCLGLPQPRCSTLYLALLNFMWFAQVLFSSLSRPFWMAAISFCVSPAPHCLVLLTNLLKVDSIPPSVLPMRIFSQAGPSVTCEEWHSLHSTWILSHRLWCFGCGHPANS